MRADSENDKMRKQLALEVLERAGMGCVVFVVCMEGVCACCPALVCLWFDYVFAMELFLHCITSRVHPFATCVLLRCSQDVFVLFSGILLTQS